MTTLSKKQLASKSRQDYDDDMNDDQAKRINEELKAVGAGGISRHLPEAKELIRALHPDEHIGGVVYGSYSGGLAWLVATDRRVIFLDHKPLFTTTDEVSYDAVSGVRSSRAGLLASVVLFTKLGNYSMNLVNAKAAKFFVDYIEKRRLFTGGSGAANYPLEPEANTSCLRQVDESALKFLKEHDLAVLSTIDRTGNVHGAVVYYYVDQRNFVYILTKSGTSKGRDIYIHNQAALTVHEVGTMQTLQLQGIAGVEMNDEIKNDVFQALVKERPYREGRSLPPVTKLHDGSFMVIRINPTIMNYHDYSQAD